MPLPYATAMCGSAGARLVGEGDDRDGDRDVDERQRGKRVQLGIAGRPRLERKYVVIHRDRSY